MDLGEILRVMRSRWYIVLPMVLLAIGLGVGVYVTVPTTYTTYTMVSLLSSQSDTKTATQGLDNPFLNFNDSLVATADFLGRRLESTDIELQLLQAGVTEKYTVALPENAQGPFLTITLTGTDKQHMLQSAATLAQYADSTLVKIQDQNAVSARDQIRLTQVIPPQKPKPELKKKLELVIVAAGGTLALTFVITFVVESISRRRRNADEADDVSPVAAAPARPATPAPISRASASVHGPGIHGTPVGAASAGSGMNANGGLNGGMNGAGRNGSGLNGGVRGGVAPVGASASAGGVNGSGGNGAGVNGSGGNGSVFNAFAPKPSKPQVGEETRVIPGPASPAAPPAPDKKPSGNDAPPDRTVIITTAAPMRPGQRPDVPVVPRPAGGPAAGKKAPQNGASPANGQPNNPGIPQTTPPGIPSPGGNQPPGKAGVPQPSGANPAPGKPPVPPAAGKRVGSSTTYQSQSADRRGQDADRVNGS